MFCGKCGKEIKEGSGFCPFCGETVKKGNTLKAANTLKTAAPPDLRKSKKAKIFLIIIAFILLCGLYNALTDTGKGKSLLKGEWRLVHINGLGSADGLGLSIQFSPNGTFVIKKNGEITQKGKWYEDSEVNKTATDNGMLWGGKVKIDNPSVSGVITIDSLCVYDNASSTLYISWSDGYGSYLYVK